MRKIIRDLASMKAQETLRLVLSLSSIVYSIVQLCTVSKLYRCTAMYSAVYTTGSSYSDGSQTVNCRLEVRVIRNYQFYNHRHFWIRGSHNSCLFQLFSRQDFSRDFLFSEEWSEVARFCVIKTGQRYHLTHYLNLLNLFISSLPGHD